MTEELVSPFRKIRVEKTKYDSILITTEDKNSSTTWRSSSVRVMEEEKDWLIEQLKKI